MAAPSTVESVAGERRGLLHVGLGALRDYGVVVTFGLLFVILSIASPSFLTPRNLLNVLDQQSTIGIVACAMTLVIIGGGFDLSAGAIYTLAGIAAAMTTNAANPAFGFLAALVVGSVLGCINGAIISGFRINAFVATLASGLMIRGAAFAVTGGFLVTVSNKSFSLIGLGEIPAGPAKIKVTILLFAAFAIACGFLLERTKFGRHVFAVGGNPEAALLSGIQVDWIRLTTFVISGFAAGLAGLINASRLRQGTTDSGSGIELDAIAAVIIGGTSIAGGEGAIWRTIVGVLLLALIGNGFNLLHVDIYYQDIAKGAIIVLAVAVDALSKRGG